MTLEAVAVHPRVLGRAEVRTSVLDEPMLQRVALWRSCNLVADTVVDLVRVDEATGINPIQQVILDSAAHKFLSQGIFETAQTQEKGLFFPAQGTNPFNEPLKFAGIVQARLAQIFHDQYPEADDQQTDLTDHVAKMLSGRSGSDIQTQGAALSLVDSLSNVLAQQFHEMLQHGKLDSIPLARFALRELHAFEKFGLRKLEKRGEMRPDEIINAFSALQTVFQTLGPQMLGAVSKIASGGQLRRNFVYGAEGEPLFTPLFREYLDDSSFTADPDASPLDYEKEPVAHLLQDSLIPAVLNLSGRLFYSSLAPHQRVVHDLGDLGNNLNPGTPNGRRNLLLLLGAGALVLSACGAADASKNISHPVAATIGPSFVPTPDGSGSPVYLNQLPPQTAFLSIAARYNTELAPGLTAISDPVQRDIIAAVLRSNDIASSAGYSFLQEEALKNGYAIGVAGCADSRSCFPNVFPAVVEGESFVKEGAALEVSRVGAQPALFPNGVNYSVFGPHQTCLGVDTGCGALSGVKTILESPHGEAELLHHGITQNTINELNRLIGMGTTADPVEWAKVGARIQAEMNMAAHGVNHYVVYGSLGVADGTFQVEGVVDAFGKVYSLDEIPLLSAYIEFIRQPHPIIEAIARGQSPQVNVLNASRTFSTRAVVGDLAGEQGTVFKSSVDLTPGRPLSFLEARQIIGGGDYSLAHLEQRGNVLFLIADNEADMIMLRTTLLTEGKTNGAIAQFLKKGGIIVETMPDKFGKFSGIMTLRTADDISRDLKTLDLLSEGLISKTISVDAGLLNEARALAGLERSSGILTGAQTERLLTLWESLRPVGSLLRYGSQFVGDYVTIQQVATYIDEQGPMGIGLPHGITYLNPVDRVVLDPARYDKLTDAERAILSENNHGADPSLLSGEVDHILIKRADLVYAYTGAVAAYYERGPGMPNAAPPWNEMKAGDVGKIITFQLRPDTFHGATHITSLVVRPEPDKSGVFIFDSENPNQPMMILDEVTGKPVFSSIPDQPTLVVSVDPDKPNLRYIWELQANKDGDFELRFVQIIFVPNNK